MIAAVSAGETTVLAALPINEFVFFINKGILAGLIIGSIYALGAVGVTLIFGILRFAHFPHGDMMTAGAFFALIMTALLPGAGPALGLPTAFVLMPVAMAVTAVMAVGLDRVFYAPLRRSGVKPIVIVMASIGVMLMMQGLIRLFAGTGTRQLYVEAKDIYRIPFGGRDIVLTEPQALLILFTAASIAALHVFLTRSRTGKAMRAVSDNPDLARVSGISIDHVVRVTWIIAGALAAAAGTLLALDVTLKPDLSFNLLLPIFAAAIVGGVGQPYGAIAGGLLVGFTETLAVFNWSVLLRPLQPLLPEFIEIPGKLAFVPTEYKIVVPFFILVAVLIWRPTGIFKGKVLK
jgi:branched-chain amino acid transport system permease protein